MNTLLDTDSRNPRACSLESLPPEVFLAIMKGLPDLASLCNLVHASPHALQVFNHNEPVNIVETVLTAGYTCKQIQFLIRFIMLLQSDKVSRGDIINYAYDHAVVVDPPERFLPGADADAFKPPPLAKDTHPATLHSLLRTARDITHHSLRYLDETLKLLRSVDPRRPTQHARQLPDPCKRHGREPIRKAIRDVPTESSWELDILWPTWVEEQRVMREIWRQRLFYELTIQVEKAKTGVKRNKQSKWQLLDHCRHAPENRSPSGNAKKTIRYFCGICRFDNVGWVSFQREVEKSCEYGIWSVVQYIQRCTGQPHPRTNEEVYSQVRGWLGRLGHGRKYIKDGSGFRNTPRSFDASRRWQIPLPKETDEDDLVNYKACYQIAELEPMVGLKGSMGITFARYGFIFWSKERMQGGGLAMPDDSQYMKFGTWATLLTSLDDQRIGREGAPEAAFEGEVPFLRVKRGNSGGFN